MTVREFCRQRFAVPGRSRRSAARLAPLFIASTLGVITASASAGAQTFEGCVAPNGAPVASIASNVNDIAMATLDQAGRPVIFYNPMIASRVSVPTRRFFYLHECAHHVLGHVYGRNVPIPFGREQEADCWAARWLASHGEFGPNEIRQVQVDLAVGGRADWDHLPGPQRAINLNACIAGRRGEPPPDPEVDDDEPTTPPPRTCRPVTRYREETTYETRFVPQQVPCDHCGMTPFGPRCLHAFHVIQVPQQVPVVQRVPYTETVCD